MKLSEPTNDFEEKIFSNLSKYGYQLNSISDSEKKEAKFSYSVGFWCSYGHAEIIIFGLHDEATNLIFKKISSHLEAGGAKYEFDAIHEEFIEGYKCTFKAVPPEKSGEYLLSCKWLYGGTNFPVMQLVFQDEDHQWPWDNNASERFRRNQPILGYIY